MIIYEASFTGLLNTLLTIALFYYGFKFLAKTVFPWLLKRWLNKKMGQFQNQGINQFKEQEKAQEFAKKHEGEVKIKSALHKTETEGIGEVIDFEEVE